MNSTHPGAPSLFWRRRSIMQLTVAYRPPMTANVYARGVCGVWHLQPLKRQAPPPEQSRALPQRCPAQGSQRMVGRTLAEPQASVRDAFHWPPPRRFLIQ